MRASFLTVLTCLFGFGSLYAASQAILSDGTPAPVVLSVSTSTKLQSAATRLPSNAAFFAKDSAGDTVYSLNTYLPVFTATSVATGSIIYSIPIANAAHSAGFVLSPVASAAYLLSESSSGQGFITVINTSSGAIETTLMLSQGEEPLGPPQISGNGATVAFLSALDSASALKLLNTNTLVIHNVSFTADTFGFALDGADHAFVLVGGGADVISVGTGQILKTLTSLPAAFGGQMVAASNGSAFYYTYFDILIAVNTSSGKSSTLTITTRAPENNPPALALSSDNSILYFLDPLQGVIATVATSSLQLAGTFAVPGAATQMSLAPNSRLDLFTSLPQTYIANLTTGEIESTFPGNSPGGVVNTTGTTYYSYSPLSVDGIDLLTGVPTAFGLYGFSQLGATADNVALGPNKNSLFAAGSDSSGPFVAQLALASLSTLQEYRLPPAPNDGFGLELLSISGIAVSPDGATLYVAVALFASGDVRDMDTKTAVNGIYVFNVATGVLNGVIPNTLDSVIADFKISPDGKTGYALYSVGGVQVIDLLTGYPLTVYALPVAAGQSGSLALSPDGAQLAAFYSPAASPITVFSTQSGLRAGSITTPAPPLAFAFTPDGSTAIAGTAAGFSFVDLSTFTVTSSRTIQNGINGITLTP